MTIESSRPDDLRTAMDDFLPGVRMTATVLGADRSGVFAISDVWRLRPVGWRVWRRHSTPATAGSRPGAG